MKFPGELSDSEFRLHLEHGGLDFSSKGKNEKGREKNVLIFVLSLPSSINLVDIERKKVEKKPEQPHIVPLIDGHQTYFPPTAADLEPESAGELLLTSQSLRHVRDDLAYVVFVSVKHLPLADHIGAEEKEEDELQQHQQQAMVVSAALGVRGGGGDLVLRRGVELRGEAVLVDLERPRRSDVFARCLAWDGSQWIPDACLTLESNDTHTSCSCSVLSRFTLGTASKTSTKFDSSSKRPILKAPAGTTESTDVMASDNSDFVASATEAAVAAAAAAVAALAVTTAIVALGVAYCKRVKVGIVLSPFRPCPPPHLPPLLSPPHCCYCFPFKRPGKRRPRSSHATS